MKQKFIKNVKKSDIVDIKHLDLFVRIFASIFTFPFELIRILEVSCLVKIANFGKQLAKKLKGSKCVQCNEIFDFWIQFLKLALSVWVIYSHEVSSNLKKANCPDQNCQFVNDYLSAVPIRKSYADPEIAHKEKERYWDHHYH
jgi:hypothetical protein